MTSDADLAMPLSAHLEELRARLIKIVIAIAMGFALTYNWAGVVFSILTRPLLDLGPDLLQPTGTEFIGTGIGEAFFTKLKVSFIAGVFLSSPVILYQLWQFVAPGLYANERRYAVGFVGFGTLCFMLGAAFCYRVIFTIGYGFFLGEYETMGVAPKLRISEYLAFSSRLLLAFGATFELPVVAFFLARVGVLTAQQLIASWRYAIVAIFVVAAILTPPDVASQLLMAGPLLVLYVVSIGLAHLARPTARAAEAADRDETPA
jgi:sec-independent protein translocase protein TatC